MAENKSQTTEAEETYVSKLSIKALGCSPQLPRGVERQLLCRIYGKAQSLKHGEDRNTGNVWTALQGTFEGVCLQEGEHQGKVLQSGKLFLPGGIQDAIEGAVVEIEKSDHPDSASVRFALELYSVKATNPIGYSYEAKNLIPAKQADELSEIRAMVTGHQVKQLPAPAPTQPVGKEAAKGAGKK